MGEHAPTRAVIFDFNGTISDDEPVLDRLFRAMSAKLGRPLTTEDYFSELAGLSDPDIIDRLLALAGIDAGRAERESLLREKIDGYKRMVSAEPTVSPAAAAFVRAAAERVPVAIASGAAREEVEHVLGLAGLASAFATVVCSEDVARGKPHPEGYATALRRLNEAVAAEPPILAGEVLVFEDADAGVQAAKAAGMRCAALVNPAYGGTPVSADLTVERLDPALVDALLPAAAR